MRAACLPPPPSREQVWALQHGGSVYVTGRSNRAVLGFDREIDEVLDAVPEGGGGDAPPAAQA